MNDDVEVQNAYSNFCKRVSDTERSNRLMQVTKHFLRCGQPLTLTPSVFLLSKLLAAVEGIKEKAFQHASSAGPGPEATLTCSKHISQPRLSSNSRCRSQLQNP